MNTYLVYFDEAGDDGATTASSDFFVLSFLYMDVNKWEENLKIIQKYRGVLKEQFGFHASEELHTKYLLSDKDPYRKYGWTGHEKREIIKTFAICLCEMKAKVGNVIVDKSLISQTERGVLEIALTESIRAIEKESNGNWKYLMITDKGRTAPMRRIARSLKENGNTAQQMIEDMLEKESEESFFIQLSDFISYFVHLYFKTHYKKENLPNRVEKVIDSAFVEMIMDTLKISDVLLTSDDICDPYGLIICSQ